MPEEDKKTVDIDTSGPGAEVDIAEKKDESVVATEAPKKEKEETVETKQEEKVEQTGLPVINEKEELKEGSKPKDEELETYSKDSTELITWLKKMMSMSDLLRTNQFMVIYISTLK